MKTIILNENKIRPTANGQSVVEGSFARVTEIRGKSIKCNNLLNFLSNNTNGFIANDDFVEVKRLNNGSFSMFVKSLPTGTKCVQIATVHLGIGTYYFSGSPLVLDDNKNPLIYLHFSPTIQEGQNFQDYNDYGKGKVINIIQQNLEENTNINPNSFSIWVSFKVTNESIIGKTYYFYPMLNYGNKPMPFEIPFTGLKNSTISGIYSQNRNLLPLDLSKEINRNSGETAGTFYFTNDIIDLLNSGKFTHISAKQKFLNKTMVITGNDDIKLTIILFYNDNTSSLSQYRKTLYSEVLVERKTTLAIDNSKKIIRGLVWFNDYSSLPLNANQEGAWKSIENQIEFYNTNTQFTETKSYQINFTDEDESIELKSAGNLTDIYFPQSNLISSKIKTYSWFADDNNIISINLNRSLNKYVEITISNVDSLGNEILSDIVLKNNYTCNIGELATKNIIDEIIEIDKPYFYINLDKRLVVLLPTSYNVDSGNFNTFIQDNYGGILELNYEVENEQASKTETGYFGFNGYEVYNNGYEKLISYTKDGNDLTSLDYGAIPTLVTEYEIEPKQSGDFSRFDYFALDGIGYCGIGYEKLKSTNQMTYGEEPSRQEDGSMENIEDYDTFVLPALEVGFNCINEETYRRLKQQLSSKITVATTYYDKDFNVYKTREMYVKPIDLDNFLSYGDEIIGMNFTLSFVATMNEKEEFDVVFYNQYGGIEKGYKQIYGRSITTPKLPDGYNWWLTTKNGFEENNHIKIKGNKKLIIFGETVLVPIK